MPRHPLLACTISLATSLTGTVAFAKPPAPPKPIAAEPSADELVDVAALRGDMKVVTDGKQHYIVAIPYNKGQGGAYSGERDTPTLFYGDGKTFYWQRSGAGGSRKDVSYWFLFWDPRSPKREGAMYELDKGKYVLSCGDRKSELQAVPADEAKAMLESAKFLKPRWKRKPYWLARDEHARYYYVDVMREPATNKQFRLFVGPKGNLKLQKMTNVVSDSKGDIFSTKAGELRLITQDGAGTWIAAEKKLPLTIVPVEDNAPMIYNELGVYSGERLGTPCDDL